MSNPVVSSSRKRLCTEGESIDVYASQRKKVKSCQWDPRIQELMEGIRNQNYTEVYSAAAKFHWSTCFADIPCIYETVARYYEAKVFEYLESDLSDKARLFLFALKYNKKELAVKLFNQNEGVVNQTVFDLIYRKKFILSKTFIDMNLISLIDEKHNLLSGTGILGSKDVLHYMLERLPGEWYQENAVADAFFATLTVNNANREECIEIFYFVLGPAAVKDFTLHGRSPLHVAADLGLKEIVKSMLRYGHEVNEISKGEYTPLDYALMKRHFSIVEILIEAGARVDIGGGKEKITAFNRAISVKSLPTMKKIYEKYGKAALVPDDEGNTATHFAAFNRFVEGLLYLHSERLVSFVPDFEGCTPIDTVLLLNSKEGVEDALTLLLNWNKNFSFDAPLPEDLYGVGCAPTYLERIIEKGFTRLGASLSIRQKKKKPILRYLSDREIGFGGEPMLSLPVMSGK